MMMKLKKILVCVSGGADSVFLLNLFVRIKDEFNLKLSVVHVNHQLRGKESDGDQHFVEELCKRLKVECIVEKIKLNKKSALEEKARDARYEIFSRICKKKGIKYCAVAHNSDDDVETILMNLIRGTGLHGFEGIPQMRDLTDDGSVKLIRPILSFSRAEIEKYLAENKINFRTDISNFSRDFTRNKIRLDLVPMLETYNQKFKKHVLNLKQIAQDNNAFVKEMFDKNFRGIIDSFSDGNIVIDLQKYIGYNDPIKREILKNVFQEKVDFEHIQKIYDLIEKKKNFKFDLKGNYLVERKYGKLYLKKSDLKVSKVEILEPAQEIFAIEKLKKLELKNKDFGFFDYDLFKMRNVVFRTRKAGDVFKPFGMQKYKKLKDYFIDEKIENRDSKILLADGKEILWIVGERICEDLKITENTKMVLRMKMKIHHGGK